MAVYLGLTVGLMGFAAWMMGQAVANTWRPVRQVFAYGLLLGVGDRFLAHALFGEAFLSPAGYLRDTLTLLLIALVGHRIALARGMVGQYPWLYERAGPFWWREKK
jgi:hypothetical protein